MVFSLPVEEEFLFAIVTNVCLCHLLPRQQFEHVFPDSQVIVREDEPSSIIALTLSSSDYVKMLKGIFRGDGTDTGGGYQHVTAPMSNSGTATPAEESAVSSFDASGNNTPLSSAMSMEGIYDDIQVSDDSLLWEPGTHMKFRKSTRFAVPVRSRNGCTGWSGLTQVSSVAMFCFHYGCHSVPKWIHHALLQDLLHGAVSCAAQGCRVRILLYPISGSMHEMGCHRRKIWIVVPQDKG